MAKYLDTSHISSELMSLLKEAKEKIILVSYSLNVNTQIQERLKTKSKLGTLSEITLIFGDSKPKKTEFDWMSSIDDLKVWQKKNLHAKCYINEKKAIISSMNLSDYSQTKSIEMGFLITKEEDPEAYANMMDDINDLKINGERLQLQELESAIENLKIKIKATSKEKLSLSELSYEQQIKKIQLENFRDEMSSELKQKSNSILSDDSINEIVTKNVISEVHLKKILKSEKKVKQLGGQILASLEKAEKFTVGRIENTEYAKDDFSYDQIEMTRMDDKSTEWYATKKELPKKGQMVGVKLNDSWFNEYIILNKTSTSNTIESKKHRVFTNSIYCTTKELSGMTGISSREINATLTALNLMEKRGQDWCATKKGEEYGAIQKEGGYGKFLLWPQEIIKDLELI